MNDKNQEPPKRNGHASKAIAPSWDPERVPFEELAAEFAERHRRGQRANVEEYARKYPEYAAEIRELFPAVIAMEGLNDAKRIGHGATAAGSPAPVERLGDFRVIGEIARGGMGIVFEAEQVTLGRRVAVKVLRQQALRGEKDVRRFQREAQTAAKLHHTNIVPVFGVGEQDGTHYIVMQLIRGVGLDEILVELKRIVADGRDEEKSSRSATPRSSSVRRSAVTLLQDELRRDTKPSSADSSAEMKSPRTLRGIGRKLLGNHPGRADRRGGQDSPATVPTALHIPSCVSSEYYRNVARIGLQAANALSYAHQHETLHRDVKPGNLLLDDEGVVWMADFGLAKAIEQDNVTWTGDIVGTLGYMAPERFEGTTDALSDVYSLGLTLYELLTFERAFDGADRVSVMRRVTNEELVAPRKRNPDVPRDLETIVLKAAARNPSDRYGTAEELAADLESFMADRPIQARRISYVEHGVRWCRRNRVVARLAATVLFLLAAVFCVTIVGYVRETAQRQRAESTSRLAVSALDEIYSQFAPTQLSVPVSTSFEEDDEGALLGHAQLPLSNDVALLLENLLRFYDDLSKQAADVDRVAVKSIAANRRVGDIHRRLGELEKAQSAYEQAFLRIESLQDTLRDTPTVRLESARIQNGLGIVLQELRSSDRATAAHRQAIEYLGFQSDSAVAAFERARSLYLLCVAQRRPRRHRQNGDESQRDEEDCVQQAVAILNELCESHPDVPDYRFLLARCLLADDYHPAGSLNDSQTKAIEILEELVSSSPDVADYRYELGNAYASIDCRIFERKHDRKRTTEELANAESRLRIALEVTADLEIRHPNIPQYYVLKKKLRHGLATILRDTSRLDEAERQYEKAIEKQRLVVRLAREPHYHLAWQFRLQLDHAQLLRDLERNGEARASLENITTGLEDLLDLPEIQENDFYRRLAARTLARTYVTLACVLDRLGEKEKADAILREAEKSRS